MSNQNVPLFAAERQQQICEIIKQEKKVLITDLCERFKITPPTARNDLHELEMRGLIKRTHGGAVSIEVNSFETDFTHRQMENVEEKKQIAQLAAELVPEGAAIIIDSGSTALEFAKCICHKRKLTVVTCDLKVAMYLHDNSKFEVILLGGTVRRGFYSTLGTAVVKTLQTICADICFLGTGGITAERGISTPGAEHAEIRRCMIEASNKTIVLADSNKIGVDDFYVVSPLNSIDVLVTDSKIRPKDKFAFENAGIEVQIAPV